VANAKDENEKERGQAFFFYCIGQGKVQKTESAPHTDQKVIQTQTRFASRGYPVR
jgi:hypothetical protein